MTGYDRPLYQMYLTAVPMFSACTPHQLELIAELGDSISVGDGDEIVREGETTDGFYVVTSGTAVVERNGASIARLGAGDYFGELSLFDPAPRNATVLASGTLSCVVLSRAAFSRALDEIPTVRDAILQGMARRIHVSDARV
ncbi:MAG: cyclic nucleotide-binding domain-containing protein [Acidimicrobiia bacterium]